MSEHIAPKILELGIRTGLTRTRTMIRLGGGYRKMETGSTTELLGC